MLTCVCLFVLDFPGACFASTKCATFQPGQTWDLTPFCGRSTCVLSEDKQARLLELVEDCGPLPLANDKCKLDEGKFYETNSGRNRKRSSMEGFEPLG